MPVILSLRVYSMSDSPLQIWRKALSLQDGNSRAWSLVIFCSCAPCLEQTFLPTSDTAVPSHSSKILLKPSCSLLPILSYLDPLECFFSWTAVVCSAKLLVIGVVRERERSEERWRGRGRERDRQRERQRQRQKETETIMSWIISCVFNTSTFALSLARPRLFLDVAGSLLGFNWSCFALWASCRSLIGGFSALQMWASRSLNNNKSTGNRKHSQQETQTRQ